VLNLYILMHSGPAEDNPFSLGSTILPL